VSQLLSFIETVHPKFSRPRAEELLAKTDIKASAKVRELSKGMVTQLHLSIITAVDAKLLVLDEPTLGLDIIFRKEFYSNLLNDYFDEGRTILITTHQVEEIENLLTDVMFINHGKLVLDATMESLPDKYVELVTSSEDADRARALKPIFERDIFGKKAFTFEGVSRDQLAGLGELHTPGIADLFVAKVKGALA
jgi:ABC-2 type transport system ATP-binding protein